MAGEGFRTWVPGEVITANNVQGYLMDQAVQVYDDAADRDAALIGFLSEGMVAYLKDTDSVEVYDGSAWVGLGGDAPIFTAGSAGQFLKSLGTAGVDWDDVPIPASATPTAEGIVFGRTNETTSSSGGFVSLGFRAGGSAIATGNVYIGNIAGFKATTAFNNVAIGHGSAFNMTTSNGNCAVGNDTLEGVTTASNNTALGQDAIRNTNASFRVGIGRQAGANGSGDGNILIGYQANLGFDAAAATNNVVVGRGAGGIESGTNNIVLGFNAFASSNSVSNEITLGNSSIATIRAQVTSITSLSDERDKTNVEDLQHGLEFVNQLRPVAFDWWQRKPDPITFDDGSVHEFDEETLKRGEPDIGFIAQDIVALEDALDEHNRLRLSYRSNPDALEVTQGRLIPILVKAIQELSAEVESLKSQLK